MKIISSRSIKIAVTILIPLIIWVIPTESIPLEGMSLLEHRVLAIFSFAILSWILEPIPIFATSVLIIVFEIFTLSDGGIGFFKAPVSDLAYSQARVAYVKVIGENVQVVGKSADLLLSEFEENKEKGRFGDYLMGTGEASLSELQALKLDQAGKGYDSVMNAHKEQNAGLISYKTIINNFAHPIIMLFLGGFFLAAAATTYRLDINLARILVKPFGTNPMYVTLGVMIITAVFSMFMSNTACTAMMLAIVLRA